MHNNRVVCRFLFCTEIYSGRFYRFVRDIYQIGALFSLLLCAFTRCTLKSYALNQFKISVVLPGQNYIYQQRARVVCVPCNNVRIVYNMYVDSFDKPHADECCAILRIH